ncbi:MAG: alginate O-acetyltransferase [Trueperaceae bacterium]|nr:alginate O-acetyltransferase [Trueperaceae bacterium]
MQQSLALPQTRRLNLLRILPISSFLLILVLGSISLLSHFPALPDLQNHDLVKGSWAAAFEADLNKQIGFRQFAIDTWGVLEYGLFKDGRSGVLVGKDNWLFSDEEFSFYPAEAAETQIKLEYINQVKAELAAKGIDLVVLLLPAKARVYEENLGRYHLPDYTVNRYDNFRQALLASGVSAPDLLTPMLEAKTGGKVFMQTDTHWTPYGARVVAGALANELGSFNLASFSSQLASKETYTGDLLNFIPLGNFKAMGPGDEQVQLESTEGQVASGGLFDTVSVPVTLVGTSYSAIDTWNFEGALKTALQTDVLNAALEGKGPIQPMQTYLADEAFLQSPPELVIWEFPERFIPVAYEMDSSADE